MVSSGHHHHFRVACLLSKVGSVDIARSEIMKHIQAHMTLHIEQTL
jgi:hypothetical protein